MISYKLAKQLKDAGFPQKGEGKTRSTHVGKIGKKERFYYPTPSEIVDACTCKDFFSLQFSLQYGDHKWVAYAGMLTEGWEGPVWKGKGDTADEALVNLYIDLNKHA